MNESPEAALIYLDHAATTPLAPEARQAMQRCYEEGLVLGNPSSLHRAGRLAAAAADYRATLALRACGLEDFGENRIQEARKKARPATKRKKTRGRKKT